MRNFIAYTRLSKKRKAKDGQSEPDYYGLDAQKKTIDEEIAKQQGRLLATYCEVESGMSKGTKKRIEVGKAIAHCKATGATLIVSRLDRLGRDVYFVMEVMNSGIDVLFCDFKMEGIAGRMVLVFLSALAEYEGKLIGERTKAALAAAKSRGVRLGNPTPGWNKAGAEASIRVRREKRLTSPNVKLKGYVLELQKKGLKYDEIAKDLNSNGFKSTYNKPFSEHIVRRIAA